MAPRSTHYENANFMCGGNLAAILGQERARGASLLNISRKLLIDHNIKVSVQTVANWCDDLGIEKPERKVAS